jgi:hypothetical protein
VVVWLVFLFGRQHLQACDVGHGISFLLWRTVPEPATVSSGRPGRWLVCRVLEWAV